MQIRCLLLLTSFLLFVGPVSADTFYLATGSNGVAGSLYIIDPATGAPLRTVGPLVDTLGNHYGLTGLAFQLGTNTLYGSTANESPTAAGHLVIVNPNTALVTDVGSFGLSSTTLADLTFDPTSGILYGPRAGSGGTADHWLYSDSVTTGVAT